MTTFLSDDFETFPTGWGTKVLKGGTITKDGSRSHGGSYSCKIDSLADASCAWAARNFTRIEAVSHHTKMWVYIDGSSTADNDVVVFEDYDAIGGKYAAIAMIKYHDGAYYLRNQKHEGPEDVCTLSADGWHEIDAYYNFSTGKINYYADGVKKGGDWSSYSGAGARPSRVYVGDVSNVAYLGNGYVWLDDLIIDDETVGAVASRRLLVGVGL